MFFRGLDEHCHCVRLADSAKSDVTVRAANGACHTTTNLKRYQHAEKLDQLSTMRRSARLAGTVPTSSGSAPSAALSTLRSVIDLSHAEKLDQFSSMRRSAGLASAVPTASGSAPSAEPSTSTSTTEVARAKLESLEKDGISFRLLEALLKHAPTAKGLNVIITDIIAASAEPNGLDQLAEFYKTGLLLPSKLPVIISSCSTAVSMVIHDL